MTDWVTKSLSEGNKKCVCVCVLLCVCLKTIKHKATHTGMRTRTLALINCNPRNHHHLRDLSSRPSYIFEFCFVLNVFQVLWKYLKFSIGSLNDSRVTHAYEVICVILQNKCKLKSVFLYFFFFKIYHSIMMFY